ncbi:MAG: TetR/AcrR family transcriptional regulator [Chloroflexi bacterium]|nr:TetR/AcrR family transcriptional regulator [Chloroflexota bacterium]
MPYPAQLSPESIIEMAWQLAERDGVDNVSLSGLAKALNVKAPSLYRYFPNKVALLQAVNTHTVSMLFDTLYTVDDGHESVEDYLQDMAAAHRSFAHQNPRTYMAALSETNPDQQPDPDYNVSLILPIQERVALLTGPEASLTALRGMLALIHGFVSLELAGQFQRGGSLDEAFNASIAQLIRGWKSVA